MEIFFLPNLTPNESQEYCLVDDMGDNEKYGYTSDPAKIDYNMRLLSRLTGKTVSHQDEPFVVGQYVVVFGSTSTGMPCMDFFSHDVDPEHMTMVLSRIYEHLPEDDFYGLVRHHKEQLSTYDHALHNTLGLAMVAYE
jgi:hypothetical protein